ncbi:MAG: hypothetical protein NTY42_10630 [Planctomycetota bacterium]|nr:hypothetical protein [Planctomycetota bacterium]
MRVRFAIAMGMGVTMRMDEIAVDMRVFLNGHTETKDNKCNARSQCNKSRTLSQV